MKRLFILLLLVIGCRAHAAESDMAEQVMRHWKTAEGFANVNQLEKAVEEYTIAIELEERFRGVK